MNILKIILSSVYVKSEVVRAKIAKPHRVKQSLARDRKRTPDGLEFGCARDARYAISEMFGYPHHTITGCNMNYLKNETRRKVTRHRRKKEEA